MILKIRKAKKLDIDQLARIYRRAYGRSRDGEDWSIKRAKALLDFYFGQKTFLGLTALVEGKIVGAFFSFIKPWHDGDHLGEGELFVDPDYQNRKIGTKLFLDMNKIAAKRRCTIHELIVYGRVARWYKKLGIKESGLKHLEGRIKDIIKKMS
ncbi:MAG: GNAT family N-acetyltransferase [Candidatus Sungbacteria bacterium]|nr:GNAT family N-acetyltransferase [Candidatus Sungbacteria bacterium]